MMVRHVALASDNEVRIVFLGVFLTVVTATALLERQAPLPTAIPVLTVTLAVMMLLFVGRIIAVILHELGHALFALCFSAEPVALYIGSYGDKSVSWSITIGRLTSWWQHNPLRWATGGLCEHFPVSTAATAIILLGGPLLPVLVLGGVLASAIVGQWPLSVTISLGILLLPALLMLIRSSQPTSWSDKTTPTRAFHSDGKLLQAVAGRWRVRGIYDVAMATYAAADYKAAVPALRMLLDAGYRTAPVYRALLHGLLDMKMVDELRTVRNEFVQLGQPDAEDYHYLAFVAIHLLDYEQALADFCHVLTLNPQHPSAEVNQGYVLLLLGRLSEALTVYDRVVKRDATDSYAHANRGWVRFLQGDTDGLEELRTAVAQTPDTNSYGWLHLGTYHLLQGEPEEAQKIFRRAQQIEPAIHLIDEWITKADAALALWAAKQTRGIP